MRSEGLIRQWADKGLIRQWADKGLKVLLERNGDSGWEAGRVVSQKRLIIKK